MAEIINCPSCQRKLQVPETLLGQDVQCPSCGATFVGRVSGRPPPLASGPREVLQDRWDADQRSDVGRPLHGDRPYDDEDDLGTEFGRRRRDLSPHRGGMILTLGILGLAVCGIFAPIAWIMGNSDMVEIRAGRMDPEGEGLTQAGKICGIIGTVFLVLGVCFVGMTIMSGLN
ncbi:MAG TPA: hypothetical protein VE988_12515 [Gemmataceae bacterium]|nr:hypothetical protein [Gemmataceae bacterium]